MADVADLPIENDAAGAASTAPDSTGEPGDDRLAFRGPIQRLLVRPEIGALVGAVGIWMFFWLVGGVFGTAAGTQNYLDVAATLGIMAVAVALLMIGGEFDLSSGAMTGATGLMVVLISKDLPHLGYSGISLHIAVPLTFAFAMLVGWINGTIVERTGLPSFIVTLGMFFALIGAKLGFAKRFTDEVTVSGLDQADGFGFWENVFAEAYVRNEHVWDDRDKLWVLLLIVGFVAAVIGVLEQTYQRRSALDPRGLGLFVIGLAAAAGGFVALLATDGTGANTAFGALIGVGVLAAVVGLGRWRFEAAASGADSWMPPPSVVRRAGLGVAVVAVGVAVAAALDASDQASVGFFGDGFSLFVFYMGIAAVGVVAMLAAAGRVKQMWCLVPIGVAALPALGFVSTIQAARATLFTVAVIGGLLMLRQAANRAAATSARGALLINVGLGLVAVIVAFFIRSEGSGRQIRVQLFTYILAAALLVVVSAVANYLFARRHGTDAATDRRGRNLALVGVFLLVCATVVKFAFMTQLEVDTTPGVIRYRVAILWFLGFAAAATWILTRTRYGSWIYAVGGNKDAARSVGVPAARTKTSLFMLVSGAAWLTGMLIAFRLTSVQADVGNGNEFEFIIAAVVGGNLLTGGYGSAAGAAIGAIIMSMSTQGIPFAGWQQDWRFLLNGAILLLAVIVNSAVRRRAERAR